MVPWTCLQAVLGSGQDLSSVRTENKTREITPVLEEKKDSLYLLMIKPELLIKSALMIKLRG